MTNDRLIEALIGLRSTAVAIIDGGGKLVEASEGFFKLLPENQRKTRSPFISRFFIQPSLEILKESSQAGYTGLFTIGDTSGKTTTLYGTFYSDDGISYFLGEHNQEEDNANRAIFSSMIGNLSQTQRRLVKANATLKESEDIAIERSFIDPLTGLGNRRRLEQGLDAEIARARRGRRRLSLIMCDLDKFKNINDEFGHDIGDVILKEFANIISLSVREFDVATRFGGEEFVILMPGTDLDNAVAAADRIRTTLEEKEFNPLKLKVTASFGAAILSSKDSPESLLKRADKALYEAKDSGRNRVVRAN